MTRRGQRGVVAALLGLGAMASATGCAARPPLAQLEAPEQAARLEGDADAVLVYRAGLRSVVAFVDARPDLVPPARLTGPWLLGPADRQALRDLWARFLDCVLALKVEAASFGLDRGMRVLLP
jgi:hypothetical protein